MVRLDGDSKVVVGGGQVMPCVALVCKTCGNTQLLNLRVLGLEEWEEN